MEAIVEHIVNLPVEDILHMDMDLEQKIAREFLECQICMDRCRNPKDLDCRHFFCEDCLVQLVAKDKCESIKCPTCRKVTLIPDEGGVAELPSNFYVSSLADVVKQRTTRASSPTTTATTTTTTAAQSPKESPVLKKLSTSASIETSSPSSASSSPSSSPSPPPPPPSPPASPPMKTCGKHSGKELGMVCMTCTEEICYVCVMETHQQPEHNCKLIEKAVEECKESLGTFQEQLQGKVTRGQRYLDAIEENRSILNDNATQVLQAIQTATTETIRAIYSRSDELIKDVRKIQTEIDNELTALTDQSTARQEDDIKKLDTIDKVLKKAEGGDIVTCAVAMGKSDPGCMKLLKPVPQGVNFVQFVQQNLGQEGGLGTLQPLDIVIIGRDNLFDDEGKDKDDDEERNKKNLCYSQGQEKLEGNLGTITVDGVTYHEVNGRSGPLLISAAQTQGVPGASPQPQDYRCGPPMTYSPQSPESHGAAPQSQPIQPQPHGIPMHPTSPHVYMGPQPRPSFTGPCPLSPPTSHVYLRHVHPLSPVGFHRPMLHPQRMAYPVTFARPRVPNPYVPHREPVLFAPAVHMITPQVRQPSPGVTSPQPQLQPGYPADNVQMRRPVPYPGGPHPQPASPTQYVGRPVDVYGHPIIPVLKHPAPDTLPANVPPTTDTPSTMKSAADTADKNEQVPPSRSRTVSSGSGGSSNSAVTNSNNNNSNEIDADFTTDETLDDDYDSDNLSEESATNDTHVEEQVTSTSQSKIINMINRNQISRTNAIVNNTDEQTGVSNHEK